MWTPDQGSDLRPHPLLSLASRVQDKTLRSALLERAACAWRRLHWPGARQRWLCAMPKDFITQRIMAKGSWDDCARLVSLWHAVQLGHSIMIEVGANVGACTVELLLRTNASILAFEPSPVAFWHLTSSLLRLSKLEAVTDRIAVFPLALGSRSSSARMTVSMRSRVNNYGASVINLGGSSLGERAGLRDAATDLGTVQIRTLQEIFPQGFEEAIGMVKLDVQGFECDVLDGGGPVFSQVRVLVAEADDALLSIQGCSIDHLRAKMSRSRLTSISFWPKRHYQDATLVGSQGDTGYCSATGRVRNRFHPVVVRVTARQAVNCSNIRTPNPWMAKRAADAARALALIG